METQSIAPSESLSLSGGEVFTDSAIRGFVSRILIRDAGTIHVVQVKDIEWIDACRNYVGIHAGGKTFLQRDTLGGLAGRLPARPFVKIHRSLIVNASKVREVRTLAKGQYSLIMSSGAELPTQRPLHEIHDAIMAA